MAADSRILCAFFLVLFTLRTASVSPVCCCCCCCCHDASRITCPNPGYKDTLLCTTACLGEEDPEDGFPSPSCGPTSQVDIVLLVECSQPLSQQSVHSLAKSLRVLTTSLKSGHCLMNARATFLLYSLYEPKLIFAHNFAPITSDSSELEQLLKEFLVKLYSELNSVGGVHELEAPLQYVAVERSIEMAAKVMKKEELVMQSGGSLQLYHRPHADLHIVTFLDLYSPQSFQKDGDPIFSRDIESKMSLFINNLGFLHKSTAFHFVFSASNEVAIYYLGQPALSVRYTDCSHFNKALTLKALIAAGEDQASSLQAHTLAEGLELQVQTIDNFARHECIQAIVPNLWGTFGLRPTFVDKCVPKSCRHGYFCSVLHGCVKRTAESKETASLLFQGKTPISVDFSTSHADLAKSSRTFKMNASSNVVTLPLEQLSITKQPLENDEHRFFTLASIVADKPKHLRWEPDKPFIEEIFVKGEPVVLRNTVVQTWSALTEWNLTYLATNMGTESLEAVKCTNNFVTFDPDGRTPLKLNISLPFIEANMSTKSFFSCVQHPELCSDGFLGHYYFGTVPKRLKKDLKPDRFLYNLEKDYEAKKQFMWISSAGMITHTHFDQDFNIFVQLVGSKRFTLWSPSQHESLYIYPRVHPLWHKSRINPTHPDPVSMRRFSRSRPLQVELDPGDMLFVPPYTWHYVETLTPSVSLSTWSHDYGLYDHMNAIYRHDHKFDLLESPRGMPLAIIIIMNIIMFNEYECEFTPHTVMIAHCPLQVRCSLSGCI